LGGKVIGAGGFIDSIYFAEIYLDEVMGKSKNPHVKLWPKYPPQIEDITLVLPQKTKVGKVIHSIKDVDKRIDPVELTDIYKNAYTFRVYYQDPKKTLTNKEVKKIRNKILITVKKKFSALPKS
jgi:phenylalanyl-tRNA synthetase beta subunit